MMMTDWNLTIRSVLAATLLLFSTGLVAQPEPGSLTGDAPASERERMAAPDDAEMERFDDWAVRCGQLGEEQGNREVCEMLQRVSVEETGQPVMEMAVGYVPDTSEPVAVFTLPLGVRLPPGVQIQVDDQEPSRFPMQLCMNQGCRADLLLDDELLAQLRRGRQAEITVLDPGGQPVVLPVSLIGFTSALERITP